MMFILKQHQVTFPLLPPYSLEVELSITVVVNNLSYHILLSHAHPWQFKSYPAARYLTCSCSLLSSTLHLLAIVTLVVKQVKFVVFLGLIQTTETW